MQNILISRAQKFFKTDIKYLAKGGFWLSTTKIIVLLTSFATSIAFANLLPPETYGTYQYVLSILTILAIPTLSGIDTALIRSVAKGNDDIFFPALKAKVSWGIWGGIASIILAFYYFLNDNSTLATAFLLASVFVPLMDPANLYVAYLSGKRDFKKQTYYQLIVRVISAILVIGSVFITSNIIILLFIYFLSYTVLRCAFLFWVTRNIKKSSEEKDDTVSYGIHLTLQTIPTVVSKTIDSILVFHLLGALALAGYALARVPTRQGMSFLNSINILALPNFSKRNSYELRTTLLKKITLSYLVIIPICLLYWVLAEPLFTIFYPKYLDFVFVSQIFSLQLLSFPMSLLDTALTAQGEKKKMYIYTISTSIIRVILLGTLIPLFGIMGAAVSFVSTSAISSILLMYLFLKLKSDLPK